MSGSKRIVLAVSFAASVLAVACGGGGGGVTSSVKYCLPAGCYVNYLQPSGQLGPEYSLTLNSDGTFVWKTGPGNRNATWTGTYSKDSNAKSVTLVVQVNAVPGQSVQTLPPGATSALRLVGTIDGAGCIVVAGPDGTALTDSLCPEGASPAPASAAAGGGLTGSVTYYAPTGSASITLNADGTVVIVTSDGTSVRGTYTASSGSVTIYAPRAGSGVITPVNATINSSGCLVLSTGALCPR